MKPGRIFIASMLSAVAFLVSATACGSEIYKWVEADGVTHYAESPPEASLSSLEVLNVTASEPVPPANVDYQSALDVANSIEASRLERERVRLEREKLSLQERELRQAQLAAQQRYEREAATYYLPRYRHRTRPYPPRYGRHPGPRPYPDGNRPGRGDTQARALFNR